MKVSSIKNYMEISGCIASSGQPEENQFKIISQHNYKAVINLAMPNSDNAIPEEGYIVTALNMEYVHIPVPFDAPNATHLTTFFKIMEIYSSEKVWVHCVLNYRVSAFLYLYQLLVKGGTDEQAKKLFYLRGNRTKSGLVLWTCQKLVCINKNRYCSFNFP